MKGRAYEDLAPGADYEFVVVKRSEGSQRSIIGLAQAANITPLDKTLVLQHVCTGESLTSQVTAFEEFFPAWLADVYVDVTGPKAKAAAVAAALVERGFKVLPRGALRQVDGGLEMDDPEIGAPEPKRVAEEEESAEEEEPSEQ